LSKEASTEHHLASHWVGPTSPMSKASCPEHCSTSHSLSTTIFLLRWRFPQALNNQYSRLYHKSTNHFH
jgi:hypothetical protein